MNLGAPIAVGFWVLLVLWVALALYRDMRANRRALHDPHRSEIHWPRERR